MTKLNTAVLIALVCGFIPALVQAEETVGQKTDASCQATSDLIEPRGMTGGVAPVVPEKLPEAGQIQDPSAKVEDKK